MKVVAKKSNNDRVKKICNELKYYNEDVVDYLLACGYSIDIIKALVSREIDYTSFKSNDVTNIDEASKKILEYLVNDNALIYVFGDYDSDGINSTYILHNTLVNANLNVVGSMCEILHYIPERTEGYGLSMYFCESLINMYPDKDVLVVTVDNGITKREEVKLLKDNGIEVIITDHHEPQEGCTPEGVLIVDPHLNDKDSKNALGLCGAAIVYKLIANLLGQIIPEASRFYYLYLANAMIATITDMMDITEENIYLVRHGLALLNCDYCSDSLTHYKKYKGDTITAKDVAFEIGPYINACGRMGNVDAGMDFLSSQFEDIEESFNLMVTLNDERKSVSKKIKKYIEENLSDLFDDKIVIIYMDNYDLRYKLKIDTEDKELLTGICGPIANQIMAKINRPVIFLHGDNDTVHGSARSCLGINLQEAFKQAQDNNIIDSFGGHKYAAGVSLNRNNIQKLRDFFNKIFCHIDYKGLLPSHIEIHKVIQLIDVKKEMFDKYHEIVYFSALKEPLFAFVDLTVFGVKRSSNNPNNICIKVSDSSLHKTMDIWAWDFANKFFDELQQPKKITIVGRIVKDFMCNNRYTIDVVDMF